MTESPTTTQSPLMKGKRGLIMGVANERSIAWGIARTLHAHGAELAFSYQGEALKKRIEKLATGLGSVFLEPCEVRDDKSITALFEALGQLWGRLDFLVHAIAFSDRDQLRGRYCDTTRENFTTTMDVSCYSLTACCRAAQPLMTQGGSVVTLTYQGSQRVFPNYNVMGVAKAALEASVRYLAVDLGASGIRVNAISAGPVKTLAASGIGDLRRMLRWNELNAPMGRNVSLDDIGGGALYLLSDLGSAVSGEILHVDSGYHAVGMLNLAQREECARALTE